MSALRFPRIADPARFGKVAVLLGGTSSEREISLLTGEAVHQALLRSGVDAQRIDPSADFPGSLQQGGFPGHRSASSEKGGPIQKNPGLFSRKVLFQLAAKV